MVGTRVYATPATATAFIAREIFGVRAQAQCSGRCSDLKFDVGGVDRRPCPEVISIYMRDGNRAGQAPARARSKAAAMTIEVTPHRCFLSFSPPSCLLYQVGAAADWARREGCCS